MSRDFAMVGFIGTSAQGGGACNGSGIRRHQRRKVCCGGLVHRAGIARQHGVKVIPQIGVKMTQVHEQQPLSPEQKQQQQQQQWEKVIGLRSVPNERLLDMEPPPARKKRGMMQHKREAFWFYRWLSFFYDTVVNPFHWTREMRDEALKRAKLDSPCLNVVDVGGGTGFSTLGIVRYVAPRYVVLMDQSAAQMARAASKRELYGVTIMEGDAESIPIRTNYADRYVSCGSIEYWPDPQRGIGEAYRILKPGGLACMVGPIRATNPISRFFCDTWMLFPTEQEYIYWFAAAGFKNIQVSEITPAAYKGVRRHGLIMGLVVTGEKPEDGPDLPRATEDCVYKKLDDWEQSRSGGLNMGQRFKFLLRQLLGTIAGFYYFVLPLVIMLYAALFIRRKKDQQPDV